MNLLKKIDHFFSDIVDELVLSSFDKLKKAIINDDEKTIIGIIKKKPHIVKKIQLMHLIKSNAKTDALLFSLGVNPFPDSFLERITKSKPDFIKTCLSNNIQPDRLFHDDGGALSHLVDASLYYLETNKMNIEDFLRHTPNTIEENYSGFNNLKTFHFLFSNQKFFTDFFITWIEKQPKWIFVGLNKNQSKSQEEKIGALIATCEKIHVQSSIFENSFIKKDTSRLPVRRKIKVL